MTGEMYYVGTDLKFAINITAEGYDMVEDDYEILLVCGLTKVQVAKNDIVDGEDEEGNPTHFLLIDSTQFPSGTLRLVVYAKVPDDDFDSGVRREVNALDICVIKHPY